MIDSEDRFADTAGRPGMDDTENGENCGGESSRAPGGEDGNVALEDQAAEAPDSVEHEASLSEDERAGIEEKPSGFDCSEESIGIPEDDMLSLEEDDEVYYDSDDPQSEDRDRLPEIPSTLPVLPVRDSVAFPGTVTPLNIGREKSKKVLDLALASDRLIGVFAQRSSDIEDPRLNDLYRVGTACRILKMFKLPDGTETIIIHGIVRVGIEELVQESPYLEARIHESEDSVENDPELEALVHNSRYAARQIMELSPNVPDEARVVLDSISSSGGLADFLAANLSLSLVHKQELLETFDVRQRLRKVYAALTSQIEVLELSQKLKEQVRGQMDKSQREYYLREQMKAIQTELGQSDARTAEVERYKERVADANMSAEAEKAANREIERMAVIPQASPEYSVAVDYVEWLVSLPWAKSSQDNLDIANAREILGEDHYGLAKIKRRILEFLAVRKLNPNGKGSILCFAGPPGVGKTSLGRSIARALDRSFIRMSLGGMRDEAEIRGHRRTYIGALPGRIIQEIKKCGSNNPVFMLDEVDKIGNDFRGDPASALLEVLDPQQNNTFTDHYLDVPFDLSDILFIATANYMEMVPPALRDRMEVINLSSYTRYEKLQIAKRYLVPRQLSENGLTGEQLSFTDESLNLIIGGYTRESGVRSLERQIGALCRAQAARVVAGESDSHRVTAKNVASDLGPVKVVPDVVSREPLPGVVTGLAYTTVGGEILFVEASRMPGTGALTLTGQIGDVMRESAHAAYSLVRSGARNLRISLGQIAEFDLHVHVPAGAVPKDGPSAGVAMLTAIISAIKEVPVDPQMAMTGEITLRGAVLPIGGVKEKVLAAHRAGITRVILPHLNMRDLEDIPQEVRDDLTFIPVKTVAEVVRAAFAKQRRSRAIAATKKATPVARKRVAKSAKAKRSVKRSVARSAAKRTGSATAKRATAGAKKKTARTVKKKTVRTVKKKNTARKVTKRKKATR